MIQARILASWLGHTDLRAMSSVQPQSMRDRVAEVVGTLPAPKDGFGPIKALLQHEAFDHFLLLSNYPNDLAGAYVAYRPQSRGRNCSVDVYHRLDPERYCYFAYPEDSTSTDLVYDHNQLVRRPRQSVFEVIFVYRPEEGTVELYAHGDKREKENLAAAFCTKVLGLSALPDDGAEPFDLSCLKDPTFAFPTDPRDGVQSVDVPLLRLDLPFDRRKGAGRRITVEAKSTLEAPQALHGLIRDALDPHQVTARDALVGRAKLRFTFRPVDGKRPKTLTFEVSYPDRCTLKDDPHDQIARKCLYEWGIAPCQRAAVAAAAV